MSGVQLVPVRCPYCGRLAARVAAPTVAQVKCGRCGKLFVVALEPPLVSGSKKGH